MLIKDVLVPIDFSPNSLGALEYARSILDPSGEITLLHVVDEDFLHRLKDEDVADIDTAEEKMRKKAQARFKELLGKLGDDGPNVETMIVIGSPFKEILRIARDLDFQMIIMGVRGIRRRTLEDVLFGSNAEKVLRGTTVPVLCVPMTGDTRT